MLFYKRIDLQIVFVYKISHLVAKMTSFFNLVQLLVTFLSLSYVLTIEPNKTQRKTKNIVYPGENRDEFFHTSSIFEPYHRVRLFCMNKTPKKYL